MAWHKIAVIAGLCSLALTLGVPSAPAQKFKDAQAALSGTDVAAAEKAAQELGKSKDAKGAVNVLLDALALGVHPKVAAAALDSLAAHGRVEAFDTVAFYLTYRDTRVRVAAVGAMGSFDDKRADNHILAGLSDTDKKVRAAAANVVAARSIKRGIEPLMALLQKGDESTAPALAAMADNDLAVSLGELIGKAPDAVLARTLGLILMRADYGPESARVEVVRALGKVPGAEAIEQLSTYVDSIPENPPRQSRREAEATIENRLENM
jgi:HEAT repeat protein